MTRAALTKLFILVIVTFIVCLPEFFSPYRVSKHSFHCVPHRRCRTEEMQAETGEPDRARIETDMCDHSDTAQQTRWEQVCSEWGQNSEADSAESLFLCQTDTDVAELRSNASSSDPAVLLEVSVELHWAGAATLNLTLYGLSHHGTLDLHSPVEQGEDATDAVEGQKATYCCLPLVPPTHTAANQSLCLLRLANRTVGTAASGETLPWKPTQEDEWWYVVRILWLVLLCLVLLTVLTTVFGQIYPKAHLCRKPRVRCDVYASAGQQLNVAVETHTLTFPPRVPRACGSRRRSELPVIEEDHSQEETETLLDENVDHCHRGNVTT